MYVDSLRMRNFRCFEDADVTFVHPDQPESADRLYPNVTLLLGDNGSGKSTVLKAVALAVLEPALKSGGFVPDALVRRLPGEAKAMPEEATVSTKLRLHTSDSHSGRARQIESITRIRRYPSVNVLDSPERLDKSWLKLFDDDAPAFFIVGYGASRRAEAPDSYDPSLRARARVMRYERVASLFEEAFALVPLSFPGPPAQALNARILLSRLMPTGFDAVIVFPTENSSDMLFRNTMLPFSALSDGYRAFLAWIGDLCYHLGKVHQSVIDPKSLQGVVLVDEIDLHLHPSWQRTVLATISQAFPNIQFIVTSHSPIVAASLPPENIRVMEVDEIGRATVAEFKERIYGLSPDQVLTSSYFGLASVRPPEVERQLEELGRRADGGDVDSQVEFLRVLTYGPSGAVSAAVPQAKTVRATNGKPKNGTIP